MQVLFLFSIIGGFFILSGLAAPFLPVTCIDPVTGNYVNFNTDVEYPYGRPVTSSYRMPTNKYPNCVGNPVLGNYFTGMRKGYAARSLNIYQGSNGNIIGVQADYFNNEPSFEQGNIRPAGIGAVKTFTPYTFGPGEVTYNVWIGFTGSAWSYIKISTNLNSEAPFEVGSANVTIQFSLNSYFCGIYGYYDSFLNMFNTIGVYSSGYPVKDVFLVDATYQFPAITNVNGSVVGANTICNAGNATATFTIEYSSMTGQDTCWGSSETKGTSGSVTVGFKAGPPIFSVEGSATVGWEQSTTTERSGCVKTSKEVSTSTSVEVPPQTKVAWTVNQMSDSLTNIYFSGTVKTIFNTPYSNFTTYNYQGYYSGNYARSVNVILNATPITTCS